MNTLYAHRSIRKFNGKPIADETMMKLLRAATRASNTGNMQLYSIIVTTSPVVKEQLSPCHFNQPMVKQAGAVVTFCADINRFSKWCRMRDADPSYDNFAWFINAAIDTLLAAQNFSIAAEQEELGICYLGTTIYTAEKIIEILDLPKGVIPVTTVVAGYPDESPPLTDRLPLEAVVHFDTYRDYSYADLNRLWSDKEASAETKALLEANRLDNLAKIFTWKRYTKEDNLSISRSYFELLKKQGFFNQ